MIAAATARTVASAMSVGSHEELRSPDVTLVTGVPHILELVGKIGTDLAPVARGPERDRDHLDPVARQLVEALLKRKPLPCEELARRARVPVREAMRVLPSLVFQGFARRREHGFVLASGEARSRRTGRSARSPLGRPDRARRDRACRLRWVGLW